MNKYGEALEKARTIIGWDIWDLKREHGDTVTEGMQRREECIERLKELQKLLDTPKGKQLLQELDLEESK